MGFVRPPIGPSTPPKGPGGGRERDPRLLIAAAVVLAVIVAVWALV